MMNLYYGSIEDTILFEQDASKNNNNDDDDDATTVISKVSVRKMFQNTSRISYERILFTFFLIFLIVSPMVLSLWKNRNISASSTTSTSAQSILFDYIIVGAGPSGIITAVNLAQRLLEKETIQNREDGSQTKQQTPLSKVLLLESGELSQSSVLRVLDNIDTRFHSSGYNIDEADANSLVVNDLDDYNQESLKDSLLKLNKFDIPFFWNELSEEKNINTDSSSSSLPFYSLHHWPINQTFLGRAIGGSGIHNAMINVRALPSDFERWNISNWTANNLMPYFDKMESYDDSFIKDDVTTATLENHPNSHRGKHGPLKTIYAGSGKLPIDPVAKAFIESSIAAGLPLADIGFNEQGYGSVDGRDNTERNTRIGAGFYEFNIRDGLRDSVASALLGNENDGFSIPKNLLVKTDATVQTILFEELPSSKPKAIGVEFRSAAKRGIFKANLKQTDKQSFSSHTPELILAAGAIMTPQILSNSGIGDGGHISNLRNVGKNVQDHPAIGVTFKDNDNLRKSVGKYLHNTLWGTSYYESIELLRNNTDIKHDKTEQIGVLGTPGFSAGAFLSSPWSDDGNPDIQLTVFPRAEEPHYSHQQIKNKPTENMEILITVALLRPEGRHTIKFAPFRKSNEPRFFRDSIPFGLPTIVPENQSSYLTDFDVKRLAWGVEQVRKIQNVGPLSNRTGSEVFPGSQIQGERLRKSIKSSIMTNAHWCGSTRMGTDASNSVVDEELRVHGVESLRIVDAGVMPLIPNGNTHSTTCAVALRGTDLILG